MRQYIIYQNMLQNAWDEPSPQYFNKLNTRMYIVCTAVTDTNGGLFDEQFDE